jgi:hypothetical protein
MAYSTTMTSDHISETSYLHERLCNVSVLQRVYLSLFVLFSSLEMLNKNIANHTKSTWNFTFHSEESLN